MATNTLFLCDWDESLFPSSAFQDACVFPPDNADFSAFDNVLHKFLTQCGGKIAIVTNSVSGWVLNTAQILPKSLPILKECLILSARHNYEHLLPNQPELWKYPAFAYLLLHPNSPFSAEPISHVVCLSDTIEEHLIARAIVPMMYQQTNKDATLTPSLSPQPLSPTNNNKSATTNTPSLTCLKLINKPTIEDLTHEIEFILTQLPRLLENAQGGSCSMLALTPHRPSSPTSPSSPIDSSSSNDVSMNDDSCAPPPATVLSSSSVLGRQPNTTSSSASLVNSDEMESVIPSTATDMCTEHDLLAPCPSS